MKNLLQEYNLHSKLYSPNQNLKKTTSFFDRSVEKWKEKSKHVRPNQLCTFFFYHVRGFITNFNCVWPKYTVALFLYRSNDSYCVRKNKGMKSFKTSQPFISTDRKKSNGVNTGTQREIQKGVLCFMTESSIF